MPAGEDLQRLQRSASIALVASLVLALAAPATAEESIATVRKRREVVVEKRAKAAAKLNALKASDAQLEKAVNALTSQVSAQVARVSAARQAAGAAEASVNEADARLVATRGEIAGLRSVLTGRAVAAYVRPQRGGGLDGLSGAKSLGDASRRRFLLDQVTGGDRDAIDALRAAMEDQGLAQEQVSAARKVAAERRKSVEGELDGLQRSLTEKGRLGQALSVRIAEFQAEVDGLATQEVAIGQVIKAREAAAPRAPGSGGGIADVGRVSGSGLVWPVRASVTSEFGNRWGRLHAGIDIGASTGTPIKAAKAGEVILAGTQGGYGNAVIVDHGGGLTTMYAHQSRVAVRTGQTVSQGELLGYVGSTGHSTGPHLHFETRVSGSPQNPRRYLP